MGNFDSLKEASTITPPSVKSLIWGSVAFFLGAAVAAWLLFIYITQEFKVQPFEAARTAVTLLSVPSAAAAIYVALRNQRVKESELHHTKTSARTAEKSGLESERRQRFVAASDQMGHDSAAVRLAGLNGMAHLADEWEDKRQACVDVLCAYLRLPPRTTETGEPDLADAEVRTNTQQLIAQGLKRFRSSEGTTCRWDNVSINLRGAILTDIRFKKVWFPEGADFSGAQFYGRAIFDESILEKTGRFAKTVFHDGASFKKTTAYLLSFIDTAFLADTSFRGANAKELRLHKVRFRLTASFMLFRGQLAVYGVDFNSKPTMPANAHVTWDNNTLKGSPLPKPAALTKP